MSSPEPQKQTLIPAGLPLSYIGGYAVVGLASMVYITAMMSGPGPSLLSVNPEPTTIAEEPAPGTTIEEARVNRESGAGDPQPENETASVQPLTDVEPERDKIAAQAETETPTGIETKYVTTQQILASSLKNTTATQESPRQTAAIPPPVEPAELPTGASNITTGSIIVPPPPERAPPPPAIIRAALKPAVAPPQPASPRPAAVRQPARAEPPAIDFGPAVVTETRAQPETTPALAILLATGSSVDSLRLTWNLLQERHAAALAGLQPRYILEKNPSVPDRGFALLAGPVVSATDVARVCSALVSEGLTCRTTSFGGNSL